MKIHPDVAAAHAQFGGDLETMQRLYDAPDIAATLAAKEAECEALRKTAADLQERLDLRLDEYAKDSEMAALRVERDHWKNYSIGQGKLIESGVFVENEEYTDLCRRADRTEAAEKESEALRVELMEAHACAEQNYRRAEAAEAKPCILPCDEGRISELVIEDVPFFVGEEVRVRVIRNMQRQHIGFQWDTAAIASEQEGG